MLATAQSGADFQTLNEDVKTTLRGVLAICVSRVEANRATLLSGGGISRHAPQHAGGR